MSANLPFFGSYIRFDTTDKRKASRDLGGADNLIGDELEIVFEVDDGHTITWLKNRFDTKIGRLSESDSRTIQLLRARDLTVKVLLACVMYSDNPKPGVYWGQICVIAYTHAYEKEGSTFTDTISKALAEGKRPSIDVGKSGVQKILESKGKWVPTGREDLPKHGGKTRTVVIKDHVLMDEKIVEQSRKQNPGCWVGTIFFWLVVAGIIAFVLHSIGLF